jgi:hypothetical protein
MAYDSEETKNEAQTNAEKLKKVREIFNEEMIEALKQYTEFIAPVIEETNEKVKMGIRLTEEEIQFLQEHAPRMRTLTDALSYSHDLLGEKLMAQSDAFFFHLRKLAEAGDEKAKKMYEEMLPKYRQAHGLDGPEMNN